MHWNSSPLSSAVVSVTLSILLHHINWFFRLSCFFSKKEDLCWCVTRLSIVVEKEEKGLTQKVVRVWYEYWEMMLNLMPHYTQKKLKKKPKPIPPYARTLSVFTNQFPRRRNCTREAIENDGNINSNEITNLCICMYVTIGNVQLALHTLFSQITVLTFN